MWKRSAAAALLLALAHGPSLAEPRAAYPAIDAYFEEEVRERHLPGAVVTIVDRQGVTYARAYGHRDRDAREPMRRDDLFRLYSMTKPITTAAVMMLVDDGAIRLNEPIGRYLPEFATPHVSAPTPDQPARTAPARNRLTIRDLLRHTSGLTYGQNGPENARVYREADLLPEVWSDRDPAPGRTNADVSRMLGAVPLAFEPGTQWAYGRSTDVLGRLVEVVSGQPLDAFLHARLFGPLGMTDTGFNVSARNLPRVVAPSALTAPREPNVRMSDLAVQQTFHSAGGGLVGSALDYARFCRMLLNGGELDGVRVLSRRSVNRMMSNQIGQLAHDRSFGLGRGYTFGFGGFVRDVQTANGPSQEFGWWGAGGTAFWCDRAAGICGILMIQQSDEARTFSNRFHDLARARESD